MVANKQLLDMTIDPIERLTDEIQICIKEDDGLGIGIGNYLIDQLKTDTVLKQCYFDKKVILKDIEKYVMTKAEAFLGRKNGAIEDKVVFGWVLHYVQDEATDRKETKVEVEVVTKEELKPKAKPNRVKHMKDKGNPKA